MKNNKKILITGADGQLGKAFSRELKKRGTDFSALERVDLDITNFKEVRKKIKEYKPNFIFNCAAYNNVDKAEEDWQNAFMINGVAVKNLAVISEEENCVLVHYSSDYVFDGEKKKPYTIADSPSPINKYGESKLLGEKFVQDFARKYYLIRLSSVFGNNPVASFPLRILSWAKEKKELKVVEDQVFSPTFTKDIVKATLDLIETKQYGLYHMTNSNYCSRYEWAKFILEKANWAGKISSCKSKDFETLAERPKFSVLDNFPLKNVINYNLPSWQEATETFLKEI